MRFVKHYGIIPKPLTNLLLLKIFSWLEAHLAFSKLKQAMATTPAYSGVGSSNFTEQFTVKTDVDVPLA